MDLANVAAPSSVRWTLPLSLALHGAALAVLLFLMAPRVLPPAELRVISVDLVPAAVQAPSPAEPLPQQTPLAAPAEVVEKPEPSVSAPAVQSDGMVEASQFFAGSILEDPVNAEVRENFPLLARDEQVVQLCNMEALEQLRLAAGNLAPDTLVGYAFGDLVVDRGMLNAEGGAFRSRGAWFHLRYHCAVSPEVTAVSAFAYAIGEPVPESQWEEHFLNGSDEGLD